MASAVLAGVNPLHGLYSCMVGPIVGGVLSSTQLMVATTTSAAALAAGQAISGLPGEGRAAALFLLVTLSGIFQVLMGVLRLGRLIRFVSYSVMTGLVTGIAVLTILSQVPTVTGYHAGKGTQVQRTIDVLANLGEINWSSLALALATLVIAASVLRTKLGSLGPLLGILLPSLVVALFGVGSVELVQDVGEVPSGVPLPSLPDLSAIGPDVVSGALAVAVIVLVQGAGVSQTVPNPDGSPRRLSRDFVAQGTANVAAGLFRGIPVGASLATTALGVISGARSRWSPIFGGIWVSVIVLAFPAFIARVAMPALGALLMLASSSAIRPREAVSLWRTGWSSRTAAVTTFLSVLFLPIEAAVAIGILLSGFLAIFTASTDISIVRLIQRADGQIEERTPPDRLPSNEVTVLDVYGTLFFAGARTLERLLPSSEGANRPVVVLRLRGRTTMGATLIEVLANYAEKLEAAGGRLYLSGISDRVHDEAVRTGKLELSGPVRVYEATPVVGESTRQAYEDARAWLVARATAR